MNFLDYHLEAEKSYEFLLSWSGLQKAINHILRTFQYQTIAASHIVKGMWNRNGFDPFLASNWLLAL